MLVIGTGAVASFLIPRLRDGGQQVQVFGSPGPRLRALALAPSDAVFEPSQVAYHGDWLVLCKTFQNSGKVEALLGAPGPKRILVLQNGLEPETDWASLGVEVERGLLTYGLTSVGPGRSVGGEQGEILLPPGSSWSEKLRAAGLQVREVGDVQAAVWWKLVINASLNVVAALNGLRNGELMEHSSAFRRAALAAEEVALVAQAEGITIGAGEGARAMERVARATSNNVCSTLADLRGGRPTEYDAINGALLRRARELGVSTPLLDELDREFGMLLLSRRPHQVAS